MLKHVLGKVWNRGFNVYGGDKFRPCLYILTSSVHNGQVHCAPRSFFGVEDFLDDDNSRPYTYQKEKKSKNPTKHVSFKQCTVAYMEPFTLDVFISKRFVSASLTHRVTSKQVAVAGTNFKDIKAVLRSRSDIPACLAIGRILADRAREADVYTASYTPRDRDKFEGKIRAVFVSYRGIISKLFMRLSPKVGELKQLEVLDLEGTEIMDLPQEIEKLTNLTCLEVSFYGYTSDGRRAMGSNAVVPCGVISALSQLEEFNIDVNPDDELRNIPSLLHFRFTVGRHVKRIISRVPLDVEFELERWERCLKYINGVGVPREIKKNTCMCTYMKSLRSIWEGSVQKNSLFLLKSLTLRTCPQLTTIFTQGLLANLCNLEELKVEDCPSIYSIVSCEISAELKTSDFLPNLKKILLHYMPGLVSISSGLHVAPKLEWLSFYNCPNLKNPLVEEVSSTDLKEIKGERRWWESLEWSNRSSQVIWMRFLFQLTYGGMLSIFNVS
uniref:Disease resistance protein At4g27190-like leucine-rich repeats domain-containing protein n=1 Tax=Fagus sylvatica TaxID=28930 RepID=A0A2N9FIY8_FAGSY